MRSPRFGVSSRWRLAGIVLALLASASGVAAARERAAEVASYTINAVLDPTLRQVRGSAVVQWRNTSKTAATELYLHLYLNAFANNRTTLMAELRDARGRFGARRDDEDWGSIAVEALQLGSQDLTAQLQPVQPDDGNPHDRTLARLPLPAPVRPGQAIELRVQFVTQLPRVRMRAGHAAPFFMVSQWFPKLAVFREGRWHAHQYHAASEFFADFGTYDVTLTVPREYVVGHTGGLQGERDNGDGTRTLVVHAENVHDFAWAADPRFVVVDRHIDGAPVRLLLQPHHRAQAARYWRGLRAAMTRYQEWIGPFPYPALTVVDVGPGALGAAGMEYPMLITVTTAWWMPARLRLPELLAVHELGHQYWYAAVASDEVNEPWLDEGINTYVEGLVMDDAWGADRSYLDLFGLRAGSTAIARLRHLTAGGWDPVTTPSYQMLDLPSYHASAYATPTLVLQTLEHLVGRERLREVLRDYYAAWRFRHPTGRDFRRLLAATAPDLTRVLAQLLDGTGVLDYAVARVTVRPVPPLRPSASGERRPARPPRYRSEIIVARRGDIRLPVEIAVTYDDGSETREVWDGSTRWYRIVVTSTHQATAARVDPDGKLPLDANRLNNSRLRTPGTRGIVRLAGRWGVWLQAALFALTGI